MPVVDRSTRSRRTFLELSVSAAEWLTAVPLGAAWVPRQQNGGMVAMEIGLLFRPSPDPVTAIRQVKAFGLGCGQLAVPGGFEWDARAWKSALETERFKLVTLFAGYSGQDYSDIPAVRRTVGFVPRGTRSAREERTCRVSDFAAALGVDAIACHAGALPEDRTSLDYVEVRDTVRRVADYAGRHGQVFALETGQETPPALLGFLRDVERPNVRINFDPANLVLYGTGDPVAALDALGPHVVSVHCKDGRRDPATPSDALGKETPLGHGSVGIDRLIARLKALGYAGPLIIEREIAEGEQRSHDIREAIQLLRRLGGRTTGIPNQ